MKWAFISAMMNLVSEPVHINNFPFYRWRCGDIAYAPQDDTLIEKLTVRENILFSARIRIGNLCSPEDLEMYVDSLISALGLDNSNYEKLIKESIRNKDDFFFYNVNPHIRIFLPKNRNYVPLHASQMQTYLKKAIFTSQG
jgi:ABC-type sugar transport system ATPase subunit